MFKQTITRIIAVILFVLLLTATIPAVSAAGLHGDENENGTIDVMLTISQGVNDFYSPETFLPLILEEVNVSYFDLRLYGLEHYYYNPKCYTDDVQSAGTDETANGIVTAMHVFIWATEKYMCQLDDDQLGKGYDGNNDGIVDVFEYVSWTQNAGSSFMQFWNKSTNLNYFIDYKYPIGKPGWGATSDQIVMEDYMAINVHLIGSSATGTSFSFFEAYDLKDFTDVYEGEEVELTLKHTLGSYSTEDPNAAEETTYEVLGDTAVYCILIDDYNGQKLTDDEWTYLGDTDAEGKIIIPSTLEAGNYYVSSMGEAGIKGEPEIAPAGFMLIVSENEDDFTPGDVDGNGIINSSDAVLVLQYSVDPFEPFNEEAADVNRDGKINSSDAVLILQYGAGLIKEF